ncbi:RNA polymerase II transcription factor B subunit 5 [Phyllosticta citrichinensis]
MPRALRGVLVQCDESIKTIIVKIDSERNDFIIEDLDDETLVIKSEKLPELKRRLNEVQMPAPLILSDVNSFQVLRDAVRNPEDNLDI